MNEVKKCSISSIAFTMEADAYATLHEYIETLKKSYRDDKDGDEIIADIEARIAELILTTQDNNKIVEKPLIDNIIAQLGSAEAISEESDTDDTKSKNREPRIPRRLYRDMENARLGGVCAGIARYYDIDPVWVRLLMFSPLLLMFLSWVPFMDWASTLGGNIFAVVILSYFVMWFSVPAARTPRQKLEMTGEKITVESIRETASASNDVDSKARPVVAETVTVFGKILLILLKILAGIIIFCLTLFVCALVVGMFVVGLDGNLGGIGNLGNLGGLTALGETLVPILGIAAILIPAVLLLYILICLLISKKPGRTTMLVLFLLWIVTLISVPIAAISTAQNIEDRVESLDQNIDDAMEEIEEANAIVDSLIEISGTEQTGASVQIRVPDGKNSTVQMTIEKKSTSKSIDRD